MEHFIRLTLSTLLGLVITLSTVFSQTNSFQCDDTLAAKQFYKSNLLLCNKYQNKYNPNISELASYPFYKSSDGSILSLFEVAESNSRIIRFREVYKDHYIFLNELSPPLTAVNQGGFIGMELIDYNGMEYIIYEEYWGDGGNEMKRFYLSEVRNDSLINIRKIGEIGYCHSCGDLKTIGYIQNGGKVEIVMKKYKVDFTEGGDTTFLDQDVNTVYLTD